MLLCYILAMCNNNTVLMNIIVTYWLEHDKGAFRLASFLCQFFARLCMYVKLSRIIVKVLRLKCLSILKNCYNCVKNRYSRFYGIATLAKNLAENFARTNMP